jgi:WD40 repeat protein
MTIERAAGAAPPGGATVNAENPWPGLLPFRESDEAFFQGRSGETEELFRMVMRERLVVLFGLSGLGKSSLLQAGLFPRLRPQRVLPVHIRLDFSAATLDLVAQVVACVASAAVAHRIEPPAAREDETLWEYFHRDGNHLWNDRNRPVLPLLVFDQFEEVFTLGRVNAARAAATDRLIEQIADLVEGRPPAALKSYIDQHPEEAARFDFGRHHYKVLVTIREDFLPELESLRPRMPGVALNRFRLRRMHGNAALDVVGQAQHLIDPDVATQIVRFVSADRAALPLAEVEVEPALLSVVCRELNNKRLSLQQDRITATLLEGSQQQVLTDFYERSIGDAPPEVRLFIEDRLLTVSGYRDSVAVENALSLPGVSLAVIDQLVERRLLRREDRGGVQRLELTHDLLTGVVRASRDARRARDAAERERVALQRQQEEQQQALRAQQEAERLELQRIGEQEKRESEKRELKRYRAAVVIVLLLMAAAIGAAVWAARAQRLATTAAVIASARELSTSALLNVGTDPELSLLLALASVDLAETQDTRDVLHRALYASRVRFNLPIGGPPRDDNAFESTDSGFKIALDPAATHVLILEPEGKLTKWDVSTSASTRAGELQVGRYKAAAFSPDRRMLVTAGGLGGSLNLWSLDERRIVGELTADPMFREFHSLAFSPSGTLLAVARCVGPHRNLCYSGAIDIWDVSARRRIVTLPSIAGIVRAMAWSSESSLAAGGRLGISNDGEIAFWSNITENAEPQRFRDDNTRSITGLTFVNPGTLLYSQAESSDVHVLYPDGRYPPSRRPTGHSGDVRALHTVGPLLATGGVDHTARTSDAASGDARLVLAGHAAAIESLAISADGTRLVTVGADAARVWTLVANGELGSWSEPPGSTLRDLSRDGRVMTISRASELVVVDLTTGVTRTIPGRVDHAPLSGDGRRLAHSFFNTVITLAGEGQGAAVPSKADGFLFQLEFSGNGQRLLMLTDGPPRVWDIPTAGYLKVPEFPLEPARSAISVDGQWVAVQGADRDDIVVWDIAGNRVTKMKPGADNRAHLVIAPDGKRLAGNAPDGKVLLWDTRSGSIDRTLSGHPGATTAITFSADGALLATGGGDRTVRVWDGRTGAETLSLAGLSAPAVKLAFSPDGTRLTAVSAEGEALVYALNLQELMAVARRRVTRVMTSAECRQFLHAERCPTPVAAPAPTR